MARRSPATEEDDGESLGKKDEWRIAKDVEEEEEDEEEKEEEEEELLPRCLRSKLDDFPAGKDSVESDLSVTARNDRRRWIRRSESF